MCAGAATDLEAFWSTARPKHQYATAALTLALQSANELQAYCQLATLFTMSPSGHYYHISSSSS
jgi:hypothetical protein